MDGRGLVGLVALCALLSGCTDQPFTTKAWNLLGDKKTQTATAPLTNPVVEVTPLAADTPKPPTSSLIKPGTGVYVGAQSSSHGVKVAAGEDVSFDFVDADISVVARTILGDMLNVGFIIDPRVTGKMTLQSSSPIKRSDVLPLLEDAFRMNGVALVEVRGQIQLVPAEAGRLSMGEARVGSSRGVGWHTQIIPLKYANAPSLQQLVDSLLPGGGAIHADTQHNALVVTGNGSDIANLVDAVSVLDVDSMAGMSFGLFPLKEVEARAILPDLENVFGHAENTDLTAPVRFVPILRLNAILVIARQEKTLRTAEQWITKLDAISDGNEPQVYVYRVMNGRAAHMAGLLAKLYPTEAIDKSGQDSRSPVAPNRQEQTLQSSSTGTFGQSPDRQPTPNAPAAPKPIPNPTDGQADSQRPLPEGGTLRVVADTVNNSLIIEARPALYRRVEKTLHKLDTAPIQVKIEATIAEVQLTDALSLGTQYYLNGAQLTTGSSSGISSITAAAPGFSYLRTFGSAKVVLDALSSVTNVNLLSSPTMMVMDNETARIQVGDQVPIITGTSTSVLTSSGTVLTQVEYHDTGVILSVTPRVSANGVVVMDIHQEVSEVTSTTSSNIDSPTFQQRRFDSTVAVEDNQTLALGGMIQTGRTKTNAGIPWLTDLPYVGLLFGTRGDTTTRTELVVMLTPHVIRNRNDAQAATEELRHRIQDFETPTPEVVP